MSKPPTHSPIARPSSHGSAAAAAAGRQPAADRRHGHRQAEKRLRVGRVALGERIPEHDRQRDRRQHAAQRDSTGTTANTNTTDDTITKIVASRAAHRAARNLAHRGARVERVHPRVDQAVEAHRGAARRHHRDDDPDDLPPGRTACSRHASSAPVSANGSANTEWLKRTNDR